MNERRRKWFLLRNWPIAWKLSLAMLVIFLLAQVFISLVSDILVRDSLLQGEEREMLERATQQAELVRGLRDRHLSGLYAIASRNSEVLLEGDEDSRRAVLESELALVGRFSDLSLLGDNGAVLASTNPELEDRTFSSKLWFASALAHNAGVSYLEVSEGLPLPAFMFYVPVPEEEGYSFKILVGRLTADVLWELVDVVRVKEKGYAYMADENAVLIAHGARDAETGLQTHALVLRPIGEEDDPPVVQANAQNLYGRQVDGWLDIPSLADFIQEGVPVPSPEEPGLSVHRYYFGLQRAQKTTAVVPVGEPEDLWIPHDIGANDWVFGVTVVDEEFLGPLESLRQGLATVMAAGVLLVFVVVVIYSRTITRPIRRLADLAARVGEGAYDERARMESGDELGQLAGGIDAMLDRLAEAMAAQRRQVETMSNAADRVREDSVSVAASAEELAASAEELNASAEEVARTVQEMARNAYGQMNQVQRTAEEIQGLDREIEHVVDLAQQVEDSLAHMRATAEETEQAVAAARGHSRRIETVVRTIEKFGRQTNMLALNATVEAARAGEMGESFTVVADEVRRMAESSRQALADVSALNEAIRRSMDTISQAMGQTRESVVGVVVLADKMAQAANRQAEASHAIVDVVNQLAAVAENNASASEQMAASVEEQTTAFEEINLASQRMAELAAGLQSLAQQLVLEQ